MIIYLVVICAVTVLGDETLIAKRDGPAIKIEWTKTEKLEISIPLLVEGEPVEEPVATPNSFEVEATEAAITDVSETHSMTPTGKPTETSPTDSGTLSTDETEHTTMESSQIEETTDTIGTEVSATTNTEELALTETTEQSTKIEGEDFTTERTDESVNISTIGGEDSQTTIENYSTEPVLTTTTASHCNAAQGKDFIFLIDAATLKERAKMEELLRGMFDAIRQDDTRNRISMVSYARQITAHISLNSTIYNDSIFARLANVSYAQNTSIYEGLRHVYWILDRHRWQAIAQTLAGKQRIVVILATSEWSDGKPWDNSLDTSIWRWVMTGRYGAQIFLVTIGQPLTPVFQYIAPEDETVQIDSFQNFSLNAIDEFRCRFSLCPISVETEMCALIKEKEVEQQILYPKCEDKPVREMDVVIQIDRAGMNHSKGIVSLVEGFMDLINPWNTTNELRVRCYGNGSLEQDSCRSTIHDPETKDEALRRIAGTEYQQGSRIDTIAAPFSTDLNLNYHHSNRTKERIMIIIASGEMESLPQCKHYPKEETPLCEAEWRAEMRAMWFGWREVKKIFLVTIGDISMKYLQHLHSF